MRALSKLAPEWWDYTTLDRQLLDEAARLSANDLVQLSRPGFTVKIYDTQEEFYLAEALEYIISWKSATEEKPAGICGPVETWKSKKVSIWHAGTHDNALGMRLTALMISKRIEDSAVPMSLLAGHPNVQFNYYRKAIGNCDVEMH
jgi:hypothetical protein